MAFYQADGLNALQIERPTLLEHYKPEWVHQNSKPSTETWSTAWSPDGAYFAWSCGKCVIRVLKLKRQQLPGDDKTSIDTTVAATIDVGNRVWSVAIGESQQAPAAGNFISKWFHYKQCPTLMLAVGLDYGRIKIFDLLTGKLHWELMDHRDVVRDVKFAPAGVQTLVSASRDGTLKVWDLDDDANLTKTLHTESKWLYACAWSPDAKRLASVGDHKSVIVWDMTRYRKLLTLRGEHQNDVCSCDFSPDGAMLATASCDTRVIIWDAFTGDVLKELLHMFPAPSLIFAGGENDASVRAVSWSRDGVHLATVSDDTYMRVWDLSSESESPCQAVVISNALCCSHSPDGAIVATGTRKGTVSMWLTAMKVLPLQHICRVNIRRHLAEKAHVSKLVLPQQLKAYLQYSDMF